MDKGDALSKEKFVGTWHLVSSEFRRADGEVTYPLGQDVVGLLIYTADGYMSANLMQTDRPTFASGYRRLGTPAEIKAAFDSCDAYFGTYTVDDEAGTVTHHVKGSTWPNDHGANQVRLFTFAGKRLTLSASLLSVDGPLTILLIWDRVA